MWFPCCAIHSFFNGIKWYCLRCCCEAIRPAINSAWTDEQTEGRQQQRSTDASIKDLNEWIWSVFLPGLSSEYTGRGMVEKLNTDLHFFQVEWKTLPWQNFASIFESTLNNRIRTMVISLIVSKLRSIVFEFFQLHVRSSFSSWPTSLVSSDEPSR